jgi:hypothetical protein
MKMGLRHPFPPRVPRPYDPEPERRAIYNTWGPHRNGLSLDGYRVILLEDEDFDERWAREVRNWRDGGGIKFADAEDVVRELERGRMGLPSTW